MLHGLMVKAGKVLVDDRLIREDLTTPFDMLLDV